MKILFLTSRLPFPPVGGDKLRTFNFIRHLKKNHEITIISFIENTAELKCTDAYQHCFDELITIHLPRVNSYRNSFLGLFSSLPLQVHYYHSKKMAAAVRSELSKGYDLIFCHLIRMAQYLPEDTSLFKVIDFTDAISLNYLRSRKYRRGIFSLINLIESKRVLKYELAAIDKSNISIFISEIDANFVKNGLNNQKIKIVANGVDFDNFKFYDGPFDENQIAFIGNMRTFPNTDAVLYFVNEVFPILLRVKPKLKFFVVGTEPNDKVLKLHDGERIFITGFVDSVVPYITNSAVIVAPMRVGAGIQNKILEAMALGTPVVTTSIGAEGLDERKLLIGNTSKELAKLILTVFENMELRKEMALRGREYIEKNYSWDAVLSNLDQYLHKF